MIAGGFGITPVMSMARYLTDRAWSGDIYFLIVAKTEQDLIFQDEIEILKKRVPRLHVCVTLTRCDAKSMWTGARGRITKSLLHQFVPGLTQVPVYLCGPNEMMDATRDLLRSVGLPDSQVQTEAFAARKSAAGSLDAAREADDRNGKQIADHVLRPVQSKTQTIRFARSSYQAAFSDDTTILEAAEAASIALQYECRSGICGQCKTRLIEGTVQMDCEDALNAADKASGLILACQASPRSNVVIDA